MFFEFFQINAMKPRPITARILHHRLRSKLFYVQVRVIIFYWHLQLNISNFSDVFWIFSDQRNETSTNHDAYTPSSTPIETFLRTGTSNHFLLTFAIEYKQLFWCFLNFFRSTQWNLDNSRRIHSIFSTNFVRSTQWTTILFGSLHTGWISHHEYLMWYFVV